MQLRVTCAFPCPSMSCLSGGDDLGEWSWCLTLFYGAVLLSNSRQCWITQPTGARNLPLAQLFSARRARLVGIKQPIKHQFLESILIAARYVYCVSQASKRLRCCGTDEHYGTHVARAEAERPRASSWTGSTSDYRAALHRDEVGTFGLYGC